MKRIYLRAPARRLWQATRAHGREIAYYAAIALALTAIAFGAEMYRNRRNVDAAPQTLPAAELAAPVAEEPEEAEAGEEAPALPEGAQLLRGYAESPAWNAALGLWESHPAADYQLPDDAVPCLLSGTVSDIKRGGALGGCVEVESGGQILRYASIEPRADLQIGDALEAGELLGVANDSMPGEAQLGPHLHLELLRNGAHADFAAWLDEAPAGD